MPALSILRSASEMCPGEEWAECHLAFAAPGARGFGKGQHDAGRSSKEKPGFFFFFFCLKKHHDTVLCAGMTSMSLVTSHGEI